MYDMQYLNFYDCYAINDKVRFENNPPVHFFYFCGISAYIPIRTVNCAVTQQASIFRFRKFLLAKYQRRKFHCAWNRVDILFSVQICFGSAGPAASADPAALVF